MTDAELMQLLHSAHRADVSDIEGRLTRERAGCLSLPRARQLALNRQLATAQEANQLSRCPHCARLVEQMESGLVHPPVWAVVRWLAALLQGDEARLMRAHLEEDACRRCNLLARSPTLNGLAKALRLGAQPAEQVQSLAEAGGSFVSPLPRAGGEPADGKLTVAVESNATNELVATVRGSGQEWPGRKASVELIGEKGTLAAEVVLHAQDAGCVGCVVFGPAADLTPRLGQEYVALVVPEVANFAFREELKDRADGRNFPRTEALGNVVKDTIA